MAQGATQEETSDTHQNSLVCIHIDRKRYESPNPTSGEALYRLGHIADGYQLYREVQGNQEDQPIRKNHEHVHLHQDEHFYSEEHHAKEFTIVVNGRQKQVAERHLTFNEVVALADNLPAGDTVLYTVTFKRGGGKKTEGTLVEGETVKTKDGTIFNVSATNRS